jgi:hypothetical protein
MADDGSNGNGNGGDGNITTWDIASSAISSLSYDNSAGEAIFTFTRGPNKQYRVPISLQQATAWAHSDSPGEYFNENIKGVYG